MTELQEMENADVVQQAQPEPLGQVLLAAREAKGLTQQDVSNSLRYSVRQIEAIEKNEFGLLPEAMITRGFIRNYARLLEIDAEPLLESYRQSVSLESDKSITVRSSIRPIQLTKESQPWFKYILASILVLLFLLAWLFYVDYIPSQTSAPVEKTPVAVEQPAPVVAEPLPEIALPAAQRQAEGDAAAAALVADVNAESGAATTAVTAPDVKPGIVAPADVKPALPAAPQPVQQAASAQARSTEKAVTMVFTGQTWVSVTDKSGKVIFEKMAHAGDKETFNAAPPLNVVIGNASATKLDFGGRDVDLAAHTKNNVARITLE